MKNTCLLLLGLVALVVTASAQTPASKNNQSEVKLTHANWETRRSGGIGCTDCAGLPQAALDYRAKESEEHLRKYEAKTPKYVATAVLKNKSAQVVRAVSVNFLFLDLATGRELVRYPIRSDLTILPGQTKKIEQGIFDTEKDLANFSPTSGESLLRMGPVRVKVVIARIEYADGSVWVIPEITDDRSKLIGNWTGESLCVGDHPACHDEKVVYRIALSPAESDTVVITADKIIDGKPETMAVLDFKFDSAKGTLVNEFTRGTTHGRWEFTVNGNTIAGTLIILPDKTVARRVQVKKDE